MTKQPKFLPRLPPGFLQSLTKSERANYAWDALLFGFITAAGAWGVPTEVKTGGYIMGLVFFLVCYIYSQIKPR